MNTTAVDVAPFRLAPRLGRRWPAPLADLAARVLERLLGLDRCADTYARVPRGLPTSEFSRAVLEQLGVRIVVDGGLDRVPAQGPLLVIANHPSGGIDGLILLAELGRLRPDLRVLGNEWLTWLPELANGVIAVDVLGGSAAAHRNGLAYRAARRHLAGGGALLAFPAGEVAALDLRSRAVLEAPWPPTIARLAQSSGAPVLPAYIDGHNGAWFQAAGLVHPRLRTALLAHALFEPRSAPTRVRLGRLARVAPADTSRATDLTVRLRLQTLALASVAPLAPPVREPTPALPIATRDCDMHAHPIDVSDTMAVLASAQSLTQVGDLDVVHVRGDQARTVIDELGRLRERAFAAVGEGTGAASDVDRFDADYDQLVLWDRRAARIAGGYRLRAVERNTAPHELYTHTLFDYDTGFLHSMRPGVELGRSFICTEYQRSHGALFALWRGIAAYVAAHPSTVVLFGAVSISASYRPASIAVLTGYLAARHATVAPAGAVRARCRLPVAPKWRALQREAAALESVEAIDDALRSVEPDGRGVPVLLRQYLKLGAQVHGFNVDRQFANSVDVLLSVDLRRVDARVLAKFMGAEAAAAYRDRHARSA